MFENSADFFGRIIVYSLDVLGEKASWPSFSNPLMREEVTLSEVQDTGWRGGTWKTSRLYCHLVNWYECGLFWYGRFQDLSSHLTLDHLNTESLAWLDYFYFILNGFSLIIYHLSRSLYLLCLWVEVPFQQNTQYENTFLLKLVYSLLLPSAKQNNSSAQMSHFSPCLYIAMHPKKVHTNGINSL